MKRVQHKIIRQVLKQYPILAITGPRQSGKTTMLRSIFSDYRYVTLENPDTQEYALSDPKAFLKEFDDKVIFDEAQKAPQLFSYLQGIVDKNQIMGQFILSGSQNFDLIENITQSLAGRVSIFRLLPFDMEEMKEAKWLSEDLTKTMVTGFYPAIFDRNISPDRYYADYINTYVKRDISQLVNIQNDRRFKRFLKVCATRAAQLVNFNDLARDAGVSHTTIRNWLSLLETSYIVYFLQPYFRNYSKRLIKSPKLYFYDTGLLCHLLDIRNGNLKTTHQMYGNIFENMVVSELEKRNQHLGQLREYWFWRDSHGHEVDLLFPKGESIQSIEIKSSNTISNKSFDGLAYFKKASSDKLTKQILIYAGDKIQNRTSYKILPWHDLKKI